mgnify:CR=1 FL=1
MTRALVLASSSPRRRALLDDAGYTFTIAEPDVDETALPGEKPEELATRLALAKARASARGSPRDACVLGADTVVVIDGALLGKPRDEAEAVEMLLRLAGRTHRVLTGFALYVPESQRHRRGRGRRARCACTPSTARPPSATPRAASRSTRPEPTRRRATAVASSLSISGSRTNVIGLPVEGSRRGCARLGVAPR